MEDLLNFVNPQGPLPSFYGSKSGNLLVMGCGTCLWDDLDRYDPQHVGDRMAVNDAIAFYNAYASKPLAHGVSLHGDFLESFTKLQGIYSKTWPFPPMQTHSHQRHNAETPNHIWPLKRDGGTSGLFGVLLGLLMGYENIVLAGMPMDKTGYFYMTSKQTYYQHDAYEQEWKRARDEVFRDRVKSLSGNTKEWLGGV